MCVCIRDLIQYYVCLCVCFQGSNAILCVCVCVCVCVCMCMSVSVPVCQGSNTRLCVFCVLCVCVRACVCLHIKLHDYVCCTLCENASTLITYFQVCLNAKHQYQKHPDKPFLAHLHEIWGDFRLNIPRSYFSVIQFEGKLWILNPDADVGLNVSTWSFKAGIITPSACTASHLIYCQN